MKLRTVLNELKCGESRVGSADLLNKVVLLTPQGNARLSSNVMYCRLCSYEDYRAGRATADGSHILMVYGGESLTEDMRAKENTVVVSHKLDYEGFRMAFRALPTSVAMLELRRERMFEAFLSSYNLAQFARKSSEVLGNPVIISNSDKRVLATAGNFPTDAADVQEVLAQGYISEGVDLDLEGDGVIEEVRHTRHSVLSNALRFGRRWVTSIVYFHHLEMGRYDVMELNGPITGFDLELIDYAGQLAGIMIDRLGAAGERVGAGSSVLRDLVEGNFVNEETMRAQLMVTYLPLDVSYAVLVITGQRNADKDYHARIGSMAAKALKSCLWCAHDDSVIILAPIGKNEAVGYDDYARARKVFSSNKDFTGMLANNELNAYVSEPLEDLMKCPGRLAQAQELAAALSPESKGRVYYFWEHRFAAIAKVSSAPEQIDMMLDKRVVAMVDYDKKHGTDYLQTAIMSVRCPGSPAEAAAALSVHRNTYFYRMNKVRELFFIDLKDGDDRLALSFSVSILEGTGRL